MMKRLKLLITVLIGIFFFTLCSYAEGELADVYIKLRIDNPVMSVNGVAIEIDAGRETSPVIVDGRTLIPVRAVTEAMGGKVKWDDTTSSAILTLNQNTVILTVGSNVAYLNGEKKMLDVCPGIIEDRTMIPIRFLAESFGFGVAWDGNTGSIYIVREVLSPDEYNFIAEKIPDYAEDAYAVINGNVPLFKEYEMIPAAFEYYGSLDLLGRCTVAMVSADEDIMPTEDRGGISSVEPTGWKSVMYDTVSGKYLYNRCHLIGYQISGENANKKNLITGTRYLNMESMLYFENMIVDYIEKSDNRVLYRVTPIFGENCMVADGVLLEAYSIEDGGSGLSFCVYCYNVQPGIIIEYETGESREAEYGEDIYTGLVLKAPAENEELLPELNSCEVYRTPSGKRYHYDKHCGGTNSYGVTFEKALEESLTPCKKCAEIKASEDEPSDAFLL